MKKTKCDFCKFKSNSGCMVTPNSHFCEQALNEYYQYLRGNKQPVMKSLRPWDKR